MMPAAFSAVAKRAAILATLAAAALIAAAPARTDGFDLAFNLEAIIATEQKGTELGYGFIVGYEFWATQSWDLGIQGHFFNGITSDSSVREDRESGWSDSTAMSFTSFGLYMTARPCKWPVQFKAGPVYVDAMTVKRKQSTLGGAVGAGLVFGDGPVNLHLFDYEYYQVENHGYHSIAICLLMLF